MGYWYDNPPPDPPGTYGPECDCGDEWCRVCGEGEGDDAWLEDVVAELNAEARRETRWWDVE